MPPESRAHLFDIEHAALGIASFVEGRSEADLIEDAMFRAAIERQFIIIGEAMSRLKKADPDTFARIREADRVVSFRHVLVHGYDRLDDATTWRILQTKLPLLRQDVHALLNAKRDDAADLPPG